MLPHSWAGAAAGAIRLLKWLLLAAIVISAGSGIHSIKQNEKALVLRFGRLTGDTPLTQVRGPGLVVTFPYPIDEVIRVPVTDVQELEIADLWTPTATSLARDQSEENIAALGNYVTAMTTQGGIDPTREGYCLTSDMNVVQPLIVVKYRISDPIHYALFHTDVTRLLRSIIVESVTASMTEMAVDAVLTTGKQELGRRVYRRAAQRLERFQAGITLLQPIEFKELVPTRFVMKDFQDVINAYVEMGTQIKEAQQHREEVLPQARSDAQRTIREAEAYRTEVTSTARAEAKAFRELLREYRRNPDLVRERIYWEKIERIMGAVGQANLVLDPEPGSEPLRLLFSTEQ